MSAKNNESIGSSLSCTDIKNICSYTGIVSSMVSSNYVYNIFKQNPNFFGLCVVDDEVPLGIITYEKLALKMSGHYGFSLFQNKPISELMDKNFLNVDHQTPISKVSYLAMSRPLEHLYDFIVVTEKGKYIGTVTIKDLLQKTTEIEVDNAKHQNPLSGLPGNLIVEQKLNYCLKSHMDYSVAYIDIDNFKAFNDVYGFECGDQVIKLLANILKDSIPKDYFIGHIGGDDFIVVINGIINEEYFEPIRTQFEFNVLSFYHPMDIHNGYIVTINRRGETEQFPLTTLTTVAVNNQSHECQDVYELTELLAKKKRNIKQTKLAMFLNR
jgi:GGDEF domain-containing protein/CBS domain-containing protein